MNDAAGPKRRPRRMIDDAYSRDAASGTYGGCRAYVDYRDLLEKEDVDAVMIATPDHTHAVMGAAKRKHLRLQRWSKARLTWHQPGIKCLHLGTLTGPIEPVRLACHR